MQQWSPAATASHRFTDGPGRGRQDRRDRTVRAEREGGIHQRIDRAHDARALGRGRHQVGEQLEVPGALLDADHARYVGHDLDQKLRREIGPGHDIVDDDGQGDGLGHLPEMLLHMGIVGPEEVMHRRDLQRRRTRGRRRRAALDGLPGRIDDDAGDHGHAPVGFLHRDFRQPADLIGGKRMALARAARNREAVDAGRQQEARLGAKRGLVDLARRRKRCRHGRHDAPYRLGPELRHRLASLPPGL